MLNKCEKIDNSINKHIFIHRCVISPLLCDFPVNIFMDVAIDLAM